MSRALVLAASFAFANAVPNGNVLDLKQLFHTDEEPMIIPNFFNDAECDAALDSATYVPEGHTEDVALKEFGIGENGKELEELQKELEHNNWISGRVDVSSFPPAASAKFAEFGFPEEKKFAQYPVRAIWGETDAHVDRNPNDPTCPDGVCLAVLVYLTDGGKLTVYWGGDDGMAHTKTVPASKGTCVIMPPGTRHAVVPSPNDNADALRYMLGPFNPWFGLDIYPKTNRRVLEEETTYPCKTTVNGNEHATQQVPIGTVCDCPDGTIPAASSSKDRRRRNLLRVENESGLSCLDCSMSKADIAKDSEFYKQDNAIISGCCPRSVKCVGTVIEDSLSGYL